MDKEKEIKKALKGISKSVKDLMDGDMLDLGVSACKIQNGTVEYIDPLDPKYYHLFPNQYGKEIWTCIPNYEGLYQISNFGRVKRLSRVINFGKQKRTTKPIKSYIDKKSGYVGFTLCKKGKKKTFRIHTVMGEAFLNHKPSHKLVVDHKNNIKIDNRLEKEILRVFFK